MKKGQNAARMYLVSERKPSAGSGKLARDERPQAVFEFFDIQAGVDNEAGCHDHVPLCNIQS
jgi:hypothetical protein